MVSHGDGTPPQAVETVTDRSSGERHRRRSKCALSTQTVAFSHYNNISAQFGIDPGDRQAGRGAA